MCISCREREAPVEGGYCAFCAIQIRAEVEDGLVRLNEYLRAWALYSEWCERRGLAAA